VDTRAQQISIQQSDGRTATVTYDNQTQVQSLQGTVRQVDTRSGLFTVDAVQWGFCEQPMG